MSAAEDVRALQAVNASLRARVHELEAKIAFDDLLTRANLTRRQQAIVRVIAERPGISRGDIMQAVYGHLKAPPVTHIVNVLIARLNPGLRRQGWQIARSGGGYILEFRAGEKA